VSVTLEEGKGRGSCPLSKSSPRRTIPTKPPRASVTKDHPRSEATALCGRRGSGEGLCGAGSSRQKEIPCDGMFGHARGHELCPGSGCALTVGSTSPPHSFPLLSLRSTIARLLWLYPFYPRALMARWVGGAPAWRSRWTRRQQAWRPRRLSPARVAYTWAH
jgi:hypothetical protein